MLRYAAAVVFSLVAGGAWAQQAPSPAAVAPSAAASTTPGKAVVPMEEPKPGDRWAYEIRDEITGTVTATRESIVTEVTPAEITVRFKNLGTNNEGVQLYDRSWNLLEERPWRFSPNDGGGIQSPLAVGKSWPIQSSYINNSNSNAWKRSGTAKVVAEESVTTRAGTFDTFKIETTLAARNVKNPTFKNEIALVTWYAPAIDHWVKLTFVSKANTHLVTNNLWELVEYSRKQ